MTERNQGMAQFSDPDQSQSQRQKQPQHQVQDQEQNQIQDQELLSLQAELGAMTAEVPDMPDSFRQSWREAVRRDAAEKLRANQQDTKAAGLNGIAEPCINALTSSSAENNTSAQNETAAAAASEYKKWMSEAGYRRSWRNDTQAKKRSAAHWRRALSLAAVAAFVLGGSLLGRESLILIRNNTRQTASTQAAQSAAREEALESEQLSGSDALSEESLMTSTSAPALPAALEESTVAAELDEMALPNIAQELTNQEDVIDSATFPDETSVVSFSAKDFAVTESGGAAAATSSFGVVSEDDSLSIAAGAGPGQDAAKKAPANEMLSVDVSSGAIIPEEVSETTEMAEAADSSITDSKAETNEESYEEKDTQNLPDSFSSMWLLGGILIGLAVFCWIFLLVTRPAGSRRRRYERKFE